MERVNIERSDQIWPRMRLRQVAVDFSRWWMFNTTLAEVAAATTEMFFAVTAFAAALEVSQ